MELCGINTIYLLLQNKTHEPECVSEENNGMDGGQR